MVEIRPATADDYDAYVGLFGELGIPDPVPTRERFTVAQVPVMRVATDGGAIVGYVTWRPYGSLAHVVQLAVDRARRGQRIGEQLLEHVRGEARGAGCERWYLNVKRGNEPAIKLYERVGLRYELAAHVMKLAWDRVPGAAGVGALPGLAGLAGLADPPEDAAIAARFALPVERLATFRARGSFRLVVVREGESVGLGNDIVGFAAFDPAFPGAAVFCADRPERAPELLDAMRAWADPRFDFVRVTVEGNAPLAEAVLAMGAELTFEILRLSSPL
ncbi:MAG: GNAT family N-acetyltransferase [Deltaproteobacteria bacterium]|nr:GNAT family N-acetyltransferase [Deltaproteobacteria bacterium]